MPVTHCFGIPGHGLMSLRWQGFCSGAYREMQLYLRLQPGKAQQVDFSQKLVTLM